jgi:ribosome-binding factor A
MTQRTDRVAEEFREILAEELQRLKDPRIGFVTVTGVDVTPDLRRAVVYYTVFGDERQERATAAGVRSATPHLRQALGRQVRLKVVPELEFRIDDSIARGRRIDELIDRIHTEEERADE